MKESATVFSDKGYFVGDVSHVLHEEVLEGFLNASAHNTGPVTEYTDEFTNKSLCTAELFMLKPGAVYDRDGNAYAVHISVIGLVPLEMIDGDEGLDQGRVFHTPGEAELSCDGKEIRIALPDNQYVIFVLR